MPRRYILSASERAGLVAIPTDETELIRLYTLSEQDLSVVKQRRGDANRLGFAVLPQDPSLACNFLQTGHGSLS